MLRKASWDAGPDLGQWPMATHEFGRSYRYANRKVIGRDMVLLTSYVKWFSWGVVFLGWPLLDIVGDLEPLIQSYNDRMGHSWSSGHFAFWYAVLQPGNGSSSVQHCHLPSCRHGEEMVPSRKPEAYKVEFVITMYTQRNVLARAQRFFPPTRPCLPVCMPENSLVFGDFAVFVSCCSCAPKNPVQISC